MTPWERRCLFPYRGEGHTGRVRIAKKGSVGNSGCPETSPCSRFELGVEQTPQGRAGGWQGWIGRGAEGTATFPWPPGKLSVKDFLFPFIRLLRLVISSALLTSLKKSKFSGQGAGAGQGGQGWRGRGG